MCIQSWFDRGRDAEIGQCDVYPGFGTGIGDAVCGIRFSRIGVDNGLVIRTMETRDCAGVVQW